MNNRKLKMLCLILPIIVATVSVVTISTGNSQVATLSNANLALLWGGDVTEEPCNDDECCKDQDKTCTSIDCEKDSDDGYCSGSTSGVSVHGCWPSDDDTDACFHISCWDSSCYGECYATLGSCDHSPSGSSYRRVTCTTASSGSGSIAPW
jgi:hypothetical protein